MGLCGLTVCLKLLHCNSPCIGKCGASLWDICMPVSESEVKQLWIFCIIVITLATHFQLYIYIHVLVAPYEGLKRV